MCVPEGDTSFVVSEEHIAVLYSLMAAWGIRHETDLTSVPNAAFCSKASLIFKSVVHEGNLARTGGVVDERIRINIIARRQGEYKAFTF